MRNGGKWTEGRYRSFITSVLRSGGNRWPPKFIVLKAAQVSKKINPKSGRLAMMYLCASCKGEFPAKEVQVDHIQPVIDPCAGFINWDVFIGRLFCEEEGLQVLCKLCHNKKTKEEKLQRNKTKCDS